MYVEPWTFRSPLKSATYRQLGAGVGVTGADADVSTGRNEHVGRCSIIILEVGGAVNWGPECNISDVTIKTTGDRPNANAVDGQGAGNSTIAIDAQ